MLLERLDLLLLVRVRDLLLTYQSVLVNHLWRCLWRQLLVMLVVLVLLVLDGLLLAAELLMVLLLVLVLLDE